MNGGACGGSLKVVATPGCSKNAELTTNRVFAVGKGVGCTGRD